MDTQTTYKELIALTKLYIHQEYPAGSWVECSQDSLDYFRSYAVAKSPSKSKNPSPAPVPKAVQKRPPPPPLPSKPPQVTKTITRTPYVSDTPTTDDGHEFKSVIEKVSPQKLAPPQERSLQKKPQQGADAIFLSLNDNPEHHAFMIRVAVAVSNHGSSGKVLTPDKFDALETPKVLVGTSLVFKKHPELKKRFQNQAKLIELPSIGDYLKDQSKKRELWKQLCSELGI